MTNSNENSHLNIGMIAGIIAYTAWGFFPVYFKETAAVPALELLAHRILWSVPFGFLIILFRKQIPDVINAFKTPKTILWLTIGACMLAVNWGVYIWTVQKGDIFQASLGYYINPLMFVLIGVAFMGETLSRIQLIAVGLATLGVSILTILGGTFPWVALTLAASFTAYGVIRKRVEIGAMPGLFIETLVLLAPAIGYLYWVHTQGQLSFSNLSPQMDWLLIAAGPITVLPLLAFAIAARRLRLSTIGFLQFIGPSLQFLTALYYGEVMTPAYSLCFGFIWLAVLVFIFDAIKAAKRTS